MSVRKRPWPGAAFPAALSLLCTGRVFGAEADATWAEVPMEPLGNDRWQAEFTVGDPGVCRYTLEAWVDHFKSWRSDLQKRIKAGQDVSVELVAGAQLVEAAAGRATGEEAKRLRSWAKEFAGGDAATLPQRSRRALDDAMAALMAKHPDRRFATNCRRE